MIIVIIISSSSSSSSGIIVIIIISSSIIIIVIMMFVVYCYGQFSEFHVCFCGLDSGNLKFETVRTNKQRIFF